jgi:flavin-dependent dehydrogenase
MNYDVLIAGGGPGGSTAGSVLKKYAPELKVLIVEREKFPREHIGESQLPPIGAILDEIGVWDEVEKANFPIKMGATYRWGKNPELWDFNFMPPEDFKDEPRPGAYAGQRKVCALQVERAIYDHILLNHAEKLGCEVRQQTAVQQVHHENDRVTGLKLSDGSTVTANHYIDASGNPAIIRRALNIPVECPTSLKNIAIWDYWENAEWADSIGVGATRIQVMSIEYGWLWFIPLSPTRTSLGIVCPVEYYKASGKTPEQIYVDALGRSERISNLIRNGTRHGTVRTTNDWSYVAERTTGNNWYLVGESAGFADPILSAGLTLTQVGAYELACTILALHRQEHDTEWLKHHYNDNQQRRVRQHMRFAEFWYSANGQFTDLQEHCSTIAKESGLTLNAKEAWRWIAQGGFTNDVLGQAGIGGLNLAGVMGVTRMLTDEDVVWQANDRNRFRLNLEGASRDEVPVYRQGKIQRITAYFRKGARLPLTGVYEVVFKLLEKTDDITSFVQSLQRYALSRFQGVDRGVVVKESLQALEILVSEGWVEASLDPSRPRLQLSTPKEGGIIRSHVEYPVRQSDS